jgi:nucleoside-diphosphate-sugar epimerase
MRLLVTGARGFVGRGLLPLFAARGHAGIATGRGAPIDLPPSWRGEARREVLEDAADASGTDAIVHLEVKQHVSRPTPADITDFHRVNVDGTRQWLDWATRHGVKRFVFISSIKAVASGEGPRAETSPLDPDTPYGGSKAAAERLVREWAAGDPSRGAVILRPAPVYGRGNEANLAAFVRQIVAGKPCLIGRGDTRKSIVSRTNLAAAIEFATASARAGCEVYNVSDREVFSLAELAGLIASLADAPPPKRIPSVFAAVAAPLGDIIETVTGRDFPLTSSRLKAIRETSIFPCDKLLAAGFTHPQSTRDGLAEMLAWLRDGHPAVSATRARS